MRILRTIWLMLVGRTDIAGSWTFKYTVDETGCGGGVTTETARVGIGQQGESVSLTVGAHTLVGGLEGHLLGASGRYPEDGAITEEHLSATVNEDGTEMIGSTVWSWGAGNANACCGTATFSASKA